MSPILELSIPSGSSFDVEKVVLNGVYFDGFFRSETSERTSKPNLRSGTRKLQRLSHVADTMMVCRLGRDASAWCLVCVVAVQDVFPLLSWKDGRSIWGLMGGLEILGTVQRLGSPGMREVEECDMGSQ
jgi:hypothetical protein